MSLDYSFMTDDILIVLRALPTTMQLTAWSMLFAIVYAVSMGVAQLKQIPVLKQIAIAFNTFVKGIPLIVQLLFCYYAIPEFLKHMDGEFFFSYDPKKIPYFSIAVIAFAINYGAYLTDVVISSYKAVGNQQLEACYSVGMTKFQAMIRVIIPQAFTISIPNLINYFMWLLKATSIASVVNVKEMLSTAKLSAAAGYQYFEAYLVAGAIYWIVCIIFEKLLTYANVKTGKYRNRLSAA